MNSKGFTLIELMIVVAIIGILMAIALGSGLSLLDGLFCLWALGCIIWGGYFVFTSVEKGVREKIE